jgi:hypothetical protein
MGGPPHSLRVLDSTAQNCIMLQRTIIARNLHPVF